MDFTSYLRRLGANVRKARWAAGLTQEQVAAHGVSYRYFQELERGRRNPTLRTLFTLARVLRTTVGALTDVEPARTSEVREAVEALRPVAPKRGRKPSRAKRPRSR